MREPDKAHDLGDPFWSLYRLVSVHKPQALGRIPMARRDDADGDERSLSPSDRAVAARVRERRTMLGITQQEAAVRIGVTYQQFHKYETGVNRISAGRLYTIADALGVDVAYFFEALEQENPIKFSTQQRLLLEISRNFMKMPDHRLKEAFVAFTRALARLEGEPSGERDVG